MDWNHYKLHYGYKDLKKHLSGSSCLEDGDRMLLQGHLFAQVENKTDRIMNF